MRNLFFILSLFGVISCGGNNNHEPEVVEVVSVADCLIGSDLNPKEVTYLYCSGLGINDISDIVNYPNVTEVVFFDNDIVDLSPLRQLKSLKWVALAENPIVDYSALAELPELEILAVGDFDVVDLEFFAELNQLLALTLYGVEISPEMVKILEGMVGLKSLTLDNTGMTTLPNLSGLSDILTLSFVNDPDLDVLGDISLLPDLYALSMSNVKAEPDSFASLTDMDELRFLSVSQVPQVNVNSLSELNSVEFMKFSKLELKGDLDIFLELDNLESLNFAGLIHLACDDVAMLNERFGSVFHEALPDESRACE